jgi:hypothetical protein
MTYLVLGALALWLVLWASGKPILKRREWRVGAGLAALAAFVGAAAAASRGAWQIAAILIILGLWLGFSVRRASAPRRAPPASANLMSDDEARSILGVSASASREEIQAAYSRLMRLAHPDKGGTSGLAAQLNAARDRLLRK